MTASALIKEADLSRMAKIAKRDGVRVEVEFNGRIIRVAPDIPDIPAIHSDKPVALPKDFAF